MKWIAWVASHNTAQTLVLKKMRKPSHMLQVHVQAFHFATLENVHL